VPVVAAQAFSREILTLSFTASLFIAVYLVLSLAYPKNHLQVPSSAMALKRIRFEVCEKTNSSDE
jgi:hypothetical protein